MHFPAIISGSKLSYWVSKIKESSFSRRWQEVLSYYNVINQAGVQLTDPSLFHPVLKACSAISFRHGASLHASIIKMGLESCTSIANSIMDFYAKAGNIGSALSIFDCMEIRDSVSWNIMISGHLDYGYVDKGLWLFKHARATGFEPNISTLVLVIQAIRNLKVLQEKHIIHGYTVKSGFWAYLSVQNSLLSMYADFSMELAEQLFDEICGKDAITWSVMIAGYAKGEEPNVALGIFREMVSEARNEVDGQTMVSALKACTSMKDLGIGRLFHGFVLRNGYDYDLFVGNSLIDMYSKCSDPDSASQAWREMPVRNIVSWNSLLSGFIYNEKHFEALTLFDSMLRVGMEPDGVTVVNILQACKHIANPFLCKCIHTVIIRQNYESNELVMNTLIDVYAKCNHIYLAWKLFNRMKKRDTVAWSTMIASFTCCGLPDEAIRLFQQMIEAQEKPNSVTLIHLIEACSYNAELERLKWAHGIAIRRGLSSDVVVGTAILDMYSRCGDVATSRKAFNQISNKNTVSFSAMIAAYGMNGLCRDALSLLAEMDLHGLKPNSVTALSVLSACSHGGLIEEGLSFFQQVVKTQEIKLSIEHYSCLVDLLSRGGKVDLAMKLIKKMDERQEAAASAWGALLSGCTRSYNGNEEIREGAVSCVLELEPNNSSGYILASNMYAAGGSWGAAARMRGLVREKQVQVVAGYSMVHVNNMTYKFVAGDGNQVLSDELCPTVKELHDVMKMKRIKEEISLTC